MRVLLIEDERELAGLIAQILTREGYCVDVAHSLDEGRIYTMTGTFDLIIADRLLPDGDSISLMRELTLKEGSPPPILVLSGCATYEERVKGLDSGADDYLIKPFAMPELIARIKALLRRTGGGHGFTLNAGNMTMDPSSGTVHINKSLCKLTRRETMLLEALLRRPGRLVSKESLEQNLYGADDEGSRGAVDVAMFRLRKALTAAGADIQIKTVHGLGYILEEPRHDHH